MEAAHAAEHPLDSSLATANLFAWGRPTLEIMRRHWLMLLGVGTASFFVSWILGFARVSRPVFDPHWWAPALDAAVAMIATSWLFAGSYTLLAAREGIGHRLGHVEPWPSILGRAAGLAVLWLAVSVAIVIAGALVAIAIAGLFGNVGTAALNPIAWFALIGASLIFFMAGALILFAPFWIGLWIRYALSHARVARSKEGPWTAFRAAWQRVSAGSQRHFWPAYAVVIGLLVVTISVVWLLSWIDPSGWALRLAGIPTFAACVALTFVIERAYDPMLGSEPDCVVERSSPPHTSPPGMTRTLASSRTAATTPIAAPLTPASAPTPTGPAMTASSGAPVPADQLATLVLQHTYSVREMRGLLGRCQDKRTGLEALRPHLLKLAQGPRVAEAVILVEAALTLDARFFADEPEIVTPLAKRVAAGGRADLAVKLLQPFVREQRGHKLHLSASLYAAHLVGQNLRKPEAARQFLLQLQGMYPNEPLIEQQLKRLGA